MGSINDEIPLQEVWKVSNRFVKNEEDPETKKSSVRDESKEIDESEYVSGWKLHLNSMACVSLSALCTHR
jgi:hypothetical protein